MIAAAVVRARRQIIAQLESAGATSADKTLGLEPRRRMHRKALEHLVRKGIVVEPQPGRYFVRADKADEWHRSLHRRAFMAAIVAVASIAAAVAAAFVATRP